jgi:hypothetical protein
MRCEAVTLGAWIRDILLALLGLAILVLPYVLSVH